MELWSLNSCNLERSTKPLFTFLSHVVLSMFTLPSSCLYLACNIYLKLYSIVPAFWDKIVFSVLYLWHQLLFRFIWILLASLFTRVFFLCPVFIFCGFTFNFAGISSSNFTWRYACNLQLNKSLGLSWALLGRHPTFYLKYSSPLHSFLFVY